MDTAQLKPGDSNYERLAREEIQHYSDIFLGKDAPESAQKTLLQPVPATWIEAEHRAAAKIRSRTGHDLNGHVLKILGESTGIRMLSLGCGPGGIELAYSREARDAQIHCIDLNPQLIALGQQRARTEKLDVRFETGDVNLIELPAAHYDLVFCHASLHHVLELERLASQIERTLKTGGHLVTVDVCTRNGYLMWPETREIVQDLFKTLPSRFRINHTAYAAPQLDDELWEADTSSVSMECIRAQDILSVLSGTFRVVHFVPYFSICRRLVDTMYGPNFDLTQGLDRALFNWIWELDEMYLKTSRLKPETFFGMYQK